MHAITESTLQYLRYAEQNVRDIAARMAEERDPTVRLLAAHALRYLERAGEELAHPDEERYGLTVVGKLVLEKGKRETLHASLYTALNGKA